MIDPKPQLGAAGILSNIAHLEHRVQTAQDNWNSQLNELQYWLDELNKITGGDSTVTTAEGVLPSFCTVKGGVQ
jgi:hypothetical protein